MRWRVEEEGESERRSVMGRIGVEQERQYPTREGADFPLVLRHEKVRPTVSEGKADDGDGNARWCGLHGQPEATPKKYRAGAGLVLAHRVPRGAFARLKLHALKGARAVSRGGGDGNVTSLPDRRTLLRIGSVSHERTDCLRRRLLHTAL
jgi:hypothetical protein